MLQAILEEAIAYATPFLPQGKVATYIPELSKANPAHLAVSVALPSGERYDVGDANQPFTMQSISKVIALILALQTAGYDDVFSHVGMEPTGDAFNSMVKLETRTARPANPMINAGAIVVASRINCENPFEAMLQLTRQLCMDDSIVLDQAVFLSEKEQGMRNRAMAYFMHSEGVLPPDVETYLDLYFRMCSVAVTTKSLSNFGLILANNGINPFTGEKIAEQWQVRIAKTLMVTCGLYNSSGEFAIKVGIPSKSGVGGGILSAVEDKMGLAVFAPALDEQGNSVGGYRILEYLSQQLGLHMFG